MPSTEHVLIDHIDFKVVSDVATFFRIAMATGRSALRLRTTAYDDVYAELMGLWKDWYGEGTPRYYDLTNHLLICAGCQWEFPGSYRLSLQAAGTGVMIVGAAAGYDEFGRTGRCPQCGSSESLLVYEHFPRNDVSPEDVDAIRRYWGARSRAHWRGNPSPAVACRWCGRRIGRDQGYLEGRHLVCEKCVHKGLMTEGLEQLRRNPHFYGAGLLRKARHFEAARS